MILKSDKLVVVVDSGWKHFVGKNEDDGLEIEERDDVDPTMLCGPRAIKELTEERRAALCEFIHNLENVC